MDENRRNEEIRDGKPKRQQETFRQFLREIQNRSLKKCENNATVSNQIQKNENEGNLNVQDSKIESTDLSSSSELVGENLHEEEYMDFRTILAVFRDLCIDSFMRILIDNDLKISCGAKVSHVLSDCYLYGMYGTCQKCSNCIHYCHHYCAYVCDNENCKFIDSSPRRSKMLIKDNDLLELLPDSLSMKYSIRMVESIKSDLWSCYSCNCDNDNEKAKEFNVDV